MDPLYIFILGAIGIILAIGVGLELSKGIEEFVIYILFWMLYIVTIATFINIILVANYYLTMKDKTGVPGQKGQSGDQGDSGGVGICDPTCRDSICENQIMDMIKNKLKEKSNIPDNIRFDNIYIKSKVHQICGSDEFKQLAPYNGPHNLINYVSDIWKIWIDTIYDAGGIAYFENMGAEIEFDWLKENPFQELKQYDIFYWGMGKQYRPQISDKCYESADGNTPSFDSNGSIVRASSTNLYDSLGNNNKSGSSNNVSFWRARQFTYKGAVYYPVGDLAIGPVTTNDNINIMRIIGNIKLQQLSKGPNRETIIVSGDIKGPVDYNLIWTNNGKTKDTTSTPFWLWRPIAPINYISLGDIVTFSASPPLTGDSAPIRCVPMNITVKVSPNRSIFWNSIGDNSSSNALILGFTPNDGSYVTSGLYTNDSICYNMFRTVIGINPDIPVSDINGSFYYLDSNKYDSIYTIGADTSNPPISKDANKVGKGYLQLPQKDAKYSVLTYLNLKNNPILTHQMTNTTINASLIPNAISNAYLLSTGKTTMSCFGLDSNNSFIQTACDELQSKQIFSIIFTGNKKNECKLQHYDTKKIINYKGGIFTLVNLDEQTNIEYQLFIMQ